jgi:apolipoprotein N-acyltransferase
MNEKSAAKKSIVIGIALSVVSGALLFASFPPIGFDRLAWIALAPLFIALMRFAPSKGAFGLYCAVAFTVWIAGLVYGVPADYAFAYLLLVPIFVGGWLLTFHLRAPMTKSNFSFFTAIAACGFVTLEFARQYSPIAQFAFLGLTQYRRPEYIQIASLFGVYGVTLMLVVANASIALVIANLNSFPTVRRQVALNVFILAILLGLNYYLLKQPLPEKGTVKVAAVQFGYVPEAKEHPRLEEWAKLAKGKDMAALSNATLDILAPMTERAALRGARIVVWPEVIIDANPYRNPEIKKRLSDLAVRTHAYIVAPYGEPLPGEEKKKYPASTNFALVVAPDGRFVQRYEKQHRITMAGIEKGPSGHTSIPVETELGKLGVMICYDADYPDIPNEYVKNGAGIFLLPSHDLAKFITRQHQVMLMFRGVERHRSLVKSDYVYGTIITDPKGRILADPDDGLQMATAEVPIVSGTTPCPWLSLVFCAGSFFALAAVIIVARRKE